PTRTSSIAPYQSLICLCAHLTYGRATLEDVENILGTPSSSYQIGRREYARYSQYGLDIVSNEKGCIIGVRSIAFVPSASLSEQTKKDMKDLQGLWEWQPDKGFRELMKDAGLEEKEIRRLFQFDGDHFTFMGGGIAPCLCFRLDTSKFPKSIELYCPDPGDQAGFAKQDAFPRHGIYQLKGDMLTLRFGNPKELKSFEGGKAKPAVKLRRLDLGRMLAGNCIFVQ